MSIQTIAVLALVGIVVAAVLVVAARATWWPTVKCRPCHGEGTRKRGIFRKRTVLCRACGGHTRRIRFTRRVANRIILARRNARNITDRMPA